MSARSRVDNLVKRSGHAAALSTASWISGVLHDVTAGYVTSFVVAAGCAGMGMATFWMVPLLSEVRRQAKSTGAVAE